MFAASTYEEIERIERQVENMEIVVFLFARPTEEKILKEFEYIHYNSARYCSIYAIGYTDDFTKAEDRTYRKVDAMMQQDWYFSMKAFTEFKEKLQNRIHWDYSGETEILILQNNPGKRNILNFQNYVAIDVNKGIREGYIDSFQSFMESLIRSSKRRVTAKEAIRDVRNARISIDRVAVNCSVLDALHLSIQHLQRRGKEAAGSAGEVYKNAVFDTNRKSLLRHTRAEKGMK